LPRSGESAIHIEVCLGDDGDLPVNDRSEQPRLLARELGEEVFDRVELVESGRPVHSAEQPTDPKRNDRHRIGLGFYDSATPLVNGSSGVARVGSLPVEVLGSPPPLDRAFRGSARPAP
jgi:hypothetical protein